LIQDLELLKKEAIRGLDRYFGALNDSIELRRPFHEDHSAKNGTANFLKELMIQVLKVDIESGKPLSEAGWRTTHGFYRQCDVAHPGWASKDTFYNRMNSCLPYLLSEKIVDRRPVKPRHGVGRAEYEHRINPGHPSVRRVLQSIDSGPSGFV